MREQGLEKQLDEIQAEEQVLRSECDNSAKERQKTQNNSQSILTAEDLLAKLKACLERAISWDPKHQLIERLVDEPKSEQ